MKPNPARMLEILYRSLHPSPALVREIRQQTAARRDLERRDAMAARRIA